MLREIVEKGDEVLNKCHPLPSLDEKLHTLLDDMSGTHAARRTGKAWPPLRWAFCVPGGGGHQEDEEIIELVNP